MKTTDAIFWFCLTNYYIDTIYIVLQKKPKITGNTLVHYLVETVSLK